MVRNYQKTPGTRSYRNYTDAQLNEALEQIGDGNISVLAASKQYKIPYGTLHNKFHGKHGNKAGGQHIFTKLEEEAILNCALQCSDWGFPLDLLELRMLAKKYLDQRGRVVQKFSNNLPGKDWALSLLSRHKCNVSQRVSRNINKARAKVSRQSLNEYFDNMTTTLNGAPPSNVFNYDETNVGDDPGSRRLIYRRGIKYPENVVNYSKSCTTIMMCGAADGTLLPPYVIYKSEHLYNTWKEGGVKGAPCCTSPCCAQGCRFNRTSHGWIDSVTFEEWFTSLFLPHARRLEGKKVLIGDNLASHLNERVINLCHENNIEFVCLIPHSTHICQPLDVAFFKPFKVAWRKILLKFKMRHISSSGIPKEKFPSLLKSALEEMDSVESQSQNKPGDQLLSGVKRNMINGFYATGLLPLNRFKVIDKIPDLELDPTNEMNNSLTILLQEKRFGNNTETQRRKRTKLNVIPGKSVGTNNQSDDSDDEIVERNLTLPSDESTINSEDPITTDEVEYLTPEIYLMTPGTYVLAKFLSGKRKATVFKYVCRIKEKYSENEFTVIGLKATNNEKTVFKLVKNDLSTIPYSDIIAVLPHPKENGQTQEFEFNNRVDVSEI